MAPTTRTDDPLWPRASDWIRPAEETSAGGAPPADLALLGVPTHRTSISPTGADATPAAVRAALQRYSTFSAAYDVDLADLVAIDLGDVSDPDGEDGERRVMDATAAAARAGHRLLVVLGGDNSLTYAAMRGLMHACWPECGLVTLDAHHDLRDGTSNGSPVRRLIEAGMPGSSVVQVGIADFSNSAAYALRARELGIAVIDRANLRARPVEGVVQEALDIAGAGGKQVYVDLDVDVCDRSVVPGCPAAAPGGISADELRRIAFAAGADPRVVGIDITEVDAAADAADGRTVRLAALLVLEAAAGLATRDGTGRAAR